MGRFLGARIGLAETRVRHFYAQGNHAITLHGLRGRQMWLHGQQGTAGFHPLPPSHQHGLLPQAPLAVRLQGLTALPTDDQLSGWDITTFDALQQRAMVYVRCSSSCSKQF